AAASIGCFRGSNRKMTTQDEDDLKLEPPQAQPPTPAPPPSPIVETPAGTPGSPASDQPPADELRPGAGKPFVEGPPMSVGEPIDETTINRTAAVAGIGLFAVAAIVVVLLAVVILLAVCRH